MFYILSERVVCRVWACSVRLIAAFWSVALKKSKLQQRRREKLWTRWKNRKKNNEEKTKNSAGTDLHQQGETERGGWGTPVLERSWKSPGKHEQIWTDMNRYEQDVLELSAGFCWNNKKKCWHISGCVCYGGPEGQISSVLFFFILGCVLLISF